MPYVYEGLALASAAVLPLGAYEQGPGGLEKSFFVACLASSLLAKNALHMGGKDGNIFANV